MAQARDDGGLDWHGNGKGEEWANSGHTLEVETGLATRETTGVRGNLNHFLKGGTESSRRQGLRSAMYFNPNINHNNTVREILFY